MRFRDRKEAGRLLAQSLSEYSSRPDVIVLALPRGGVPVAAGSTCELFNQPAEGMVCVCAETGEPFYAVGLWYENFSQTTDQEVRELLNRARRRTETEARPVNRFGGGRHLAGV